MVIPMGLNGPAWRRFAVGRGKNGGYWLLDAVRARGIREDRAVRTGPNPPITNDVTSPLAHRGGSAGLAKE